MKLYITAVTKKKQTGIQNYFLQIIQEIIKNYIYVAVTIKLLQNQNFSFSLSLLQLSNDSKEFYYFVSQVKQKIKSQPQRSLKFEILPLFFDIKNCWKMHYFHRQSFFKFLLSHPVYLNTVPLSRSPLSFYPSFSISL